eukprot:458453_1
MAEMTYKYSYKLEKTVVDKILNNQHHHVFFQILAFQCCLKVINKILWVEISEYSKDITYGIKWRVVVNELNVEKIWYANYKSATEKPNNNTICITDLSDIRILNEMNIDVYMVFIDIYSVKGEILTTKYCTDDISIQRMKPICTSSVEWRLPSMTMALCYGYLKNVINIYVPSDIIELCFIYLQDESNPIDIMKTQDTVTFESNIIKLNVFQWRIYLEIKKNIKQKLVDIKLSIRLLTLSPMIKQIYAYLRVNCNQLDFDMNPEYTNNLFCWSHHNMDQLISFSNEDTSEFNTILSSIKNLTLNVEIALLNVYRIQTANSKEMELSYVDYQYQSQYVLSYATGQFIWKFDPILAQKSHIFEMHGFQWQLQLKYNKNCLYTSDDVVEVILLLIAKPEDVHCIQLSWQSEWIEFQKGSDGWLNFSTESKPKFMKCWNSCDKYSKRIFRKDLKTLELNTFRLDLMLCGVYDVNGYCITDKYINFNGESHTIKDWLANQVKLLKYYDIFIKYGVRNMDHVLSLDMDKLNRFGIANINDKVKILREIEKRKHV